jgi:alpha-L-fucosidase
MKNAVLRAMSGLVLLAAAAVPATAAESPDDFAQRTEWWRHGKFGMFVHWGVYAVPADSSKGAAEWYMTGHQVPVAQYEKFAPQFNPTDFDAKKWVQTAKAAGMTYIVITSKHHDGFALWDSRLTDYTITKATPFKRDVLKELADACKEQGIVLCFYHSIMDWHHPDYLPRRPWDKRPAEGADFERYVTYMKGQLRELLTNYGRIGILWFDGEWEPTWTHERGVDLYNYVRGLQPGIIINNRVGKGRDGMAGLTKDAAAPGDYDTPEQEIPATALRAGRLWETCMTMNNTWGFSRTDENWKSTEDLTRKLIDIASKGGNFLLNVGPDEKGNIPPASIERLAAVGQWMRANGESVYGTTKSPWRRPTFDGRVTTKGNTLYVHVFNWPKDGLTLAGLKTPVKSAKFLADGAAANVKQDGTEAAPTLTIAAPAKPDPIATVVALELAGPPEIEEPRTLPAADGTIPLKAADAEVHGRTARYESGNGRDNIGYWVNQGDFVSWDVNVPYAGKYALLLTYACDAQTAGSEFTVGDGENVLAGKVAATGQWTDFRTVFLGEIELAKGTRTIAVKAKSMPGNAVMNLKQLVLVPR